MNDELILLTVKVDPDGDWMVDDLKRMKRILNERGYDATYHMIQLAYELYSEEYYAAGWYSIDGLSDETVFNTLMLVMRPHKGNSTHDEVR